MVTSFLKYNINNACIESYLFSYPVWQKSGTQYSLCVQVIIIIVGYCLLCMLYLLHELLVTFFNVTARRIKKNLVFTFSPFSTFLFSIYNYICTLLPCRRIRHRLHFKMETRMICQCYLDNTPQILAQFCVDYYVCTDMPFNPSNMRFTIS